MERRDGVRFGESEGDFLFGCGSGWAWCVKKRALFGPACGCTGAFFVGLARYRSRCPPSRTTKHPRGTARAAHGLQT